MYSLKTVVRILDNLYMVDRIFNVNSFTVNDQNLALIKLWTGSTDVFFREDMAFFCSLIEVVDTLEEIVEVLERPKITEFKCTVIETIYPKSEEEITEALPEEKPQEVAETQAE